MFGKLFDENMITAIMNAPKMCKEMDNKRIDMSALEFMCAVPIVAKVLEMSNKERKGAIDFASAVVALNITEKGKKLFNGPVQEFKNELLTKFAQTENPPRKHSRIWRAQEGRICCRCRADRISKVQAA